MKAVAECIPCYLRQCINALDKGEIEKDKQADILYKLIEEIPKLDKEKSPAENSTVILHRLVEIIGGKDPFAKAKRESNQLALSLYSRMKELINTSKDPLYTAFKLAVAGNIIDLGIFQDYDLEKAIKEALDTPFAINDYAELNNFIKEGNKKIFIIGDNSGEILFDRLLIEELKNYQVDIKYGVKGGFIINDATLEDAKEVGMTEITEVISSGCNYLGTLEDKCSKEFIKYFGEADIIISKGQANYESLESTKFAGVKTFFILKAKCPEVAKNLGVNFGDIVLARNK